MIKKITKPLLLLSIFLLTILAGSPILASSGSGEAAAVAPVPRSFNKKELATLQEHRDFAYIHADLDSDTWWDRFKRWFNSRLAMLFNTGKTTGMVLKVVFYLACGAIVVYALLKLMGIDTSSLFTRKSATAIRATQMAEEDIYAIDLEALLAEALQQKEYRKATRFLYLLALKSLSDKELINWQPGKTNREYYTELANHPSEAAFKQLGYYFEYTWYGNFMVSEASFSQIRDTAASLQKQIKAL
jgi:hypothetical protein